MDLQSYYEEQKREQMQGPALKRLEEEQQQQAQTPQLVPLHPHQLQDTLLSDERHSDQQQAQLHISADDALSEQQPSALQLNNARSWLGASRQHQAVTQPDLSWGEPPSTAGTATSLGTNNKVARPRSASKPPLPSRSRGQISREMSYLGWSAGSSGTTASSDSNT